MHIGISEHSLTSNDFNRDTMIKMLGRESQNTNLERKKRKAASCIDLLEYMPYSRLLNMRFPGCTLDQIAGTPVQYLIRTHLGHRHERPSYDNHHTLDSVA